MGIRSRVKGWFIQLKDYFKSLDLNSEGHEVNIVDNDNDSVEDELKAICIEKYLVSVDAEIDYTDKNGNKTRRNICTDEIYEYDDGVLVIRAFCKKRNDYRTFVSKRIDFWKDTETGENIKYDKHDDQDLREYLKKFANADPGNIANEMYEKYIHEINIVCGTLERWSQEKKGFGLLVNWISEKEFSKELLRPLTGVSRDEAWEELLYMIKESQVNVTPIKGSVRALLRASDARKNALVGFVEKILEGQASQSSAVQTLRDDLRAEGGELGYDIPVIPGPQGEQVDAIKKKSIEAKANYKSRKDKKRRSKNYRASERGNAIKLVSFDEAKSKLASKINKGDLVFDREAFEEEVRREVCKVFTQEELDNEGDMLLRRFHCGISLAYLSFGLKMKNDGWYKDENGRYVINLGNAIAED